MKTQERQSVVWVSEQARGEYQAAKSALLGLLDGLRTAVAADVGLHHLLGAAHWGHVGDMQRLEREIGELNQRVCGLGEYSRSASGQKQGGVA